MRAIINDEPATPGFDEGYFAQQVIDAAVLSDREGKRVEVG